MKKVLLSIFALLGLIAIGAVIWLSTLDGKIEVEKSTTIDKPISEAYETVVDFNSWAQWSPWLCIEPSAEVNITNDGINTGDIYAWGGEIVGAGEIEHKALTSNKYIEQQIRFTKPYESTSKVYWKFEAITDSTTKVSWGMHGEMPFFLRFMAKQMEPWIGMDYDRGLLMLKDLIETGSVNTELTINGVDAFEGFTFVGKKEVCPMEDISTSMTETFGVLDELCSTDKLTFDKAITIYHNFDFTSPDCEYTSGIPVKEDYKPSSDEFYIGSIPTTKVVKVTLKGHYQYLGNAWSAAYMYLNHKKLKPNNEVDVFEVYLTDPNKEPDSTKWITEVYLPVK